MKKWIDENLEKWLDKLSLISNFKKWDYDQYLDKHYPRIKQDIEKWMKIPRDCNFAIPILLRDAIYATVKNHKPFIKHLESREYPHLLDDQKLFEEITKVGDVVYGAINDGL